MSEATVQILTVSATLLVGIVVLWRREVSALQARLREAGAATSGAEARAEAAQAGLASAQEDLRRRAAELDAELETARQFYEAQVREADAGREGELAMLRGDLARLEAFRTRLAAEDDFDRSMREVVAEAESLRGEARALLVEARSAREVQEKDARDRREAVATEAARVLAQAAAEVQRLTAEAESRLQRFEADAVELLADKARLERAAEAVRNLLEGYGDRYLVPSRSLLDGLASDFGHVEAGQMLAAARAASGSMVLEGRAALCDYVEANRRGTAIDFAIDAFNGRVDAVLTRVRHDNAGSLEQEIRDAFALVNLHGSAFRNARITEEYLQARLQELRWAVSVEELRRRAREEQRRIREQIREEEKARREYERQLRETLEDEEKIRKAIESTRREAQAGSAEQQARYEAEIVALQQKLADAEAKAERTRSMAEQTRKGVIYVISNPGSLGDDVLKIGMTRRLDPMERVWELSDASVPFDYEIHAMIPCDDAPAMEKELHRLFDDYRVNRVNYRREFFRVPLEEVRRAIAGRGIEVQFTLVAESREYRESLALAKLPAEERRRTRGETGAAADAAPGGEGCVD